MEMDKSLDNKTHVGATTHPDVSPVGFDVDEKKDLPPRHVLALLPEEVWGVVLERVVDSYDLLNCYYTDPLWSDILEPDKSKWLFDLCFPSLFKYLRKNDILKCRQVSRSWKNTIDHYLEKDQFLLYNSTTHFLFKKTVELNFGHADEDMAAVERFRDQMKSSVENPIVSRSVHIGDLPNLHAFLRDFGVHIWHLTMSVFPEEGTPVDFVQYLRDILMCTPNLRTFQAMGYVNDEGGRVADVLEEENLLRRFFTDNPLPQMPHLHTLDLRLRDIHTNDDIVRIIDAQFLTAYGSQLRRLFQGHRVPMEAPFSNLTDLSLMIHSADQLNTLHNFSCQLEVLDLIIHTTQINFRHLFRSIEHFRRTLKILSLRFYAQSPHRIQFGKSVQFPKRISLPHLQELRLEDVCARSDMSFDFLAGLVSLRRLEIHFCEYSKLDDEPRRKERVLIHEHLDEYGKGTEFGMYFSNIWQILPWLEKFVLWRIGFRYRRVFSRGFYEYLHAQLRKRLLEQMSQL